MANKKAIDQAVLDAVELVQRESEFAPESVWHPDFGWVLWRGKPTKALKEFLKEANKKKGR